MTSRTLVLIGLVTSVSLAGLPAVGVAQGQQAPAETAIKMETAHGELVTVDAKANTFSIKPAKGAELRFQYNDQTKVTGGQGGVAGLATVSGRQVTVQYTMQGANRLATSIGIAPLAGGQPPAQQPDAPRIQQPDQPR
jgi:hypothetical protein